MSCDHQRIVDYVHGELEAPAASACADHLASCAACRREVEELEGTRALLRAWPDEPSELDLAAIRAAAQTRRWRWPVWLRPSSWPRPVLPLAAAALAAFVLLAAGDIQFSYQSGRMELTVGLGASPPAPTPTPTMTTSCLIPVSLAAQCPMSSCSDSQRRIVFTRARAISGFSLH